MGTCPLCASTAVVGLGLIPSGETKISAPKPNKTNQTVKSQSKTVSAGAARRGNGLMGSFSLGR